MKEKKYTPVCERPESKIKIVKCQKCGTQIATFSWQVDYKKAPKSCKNCK